MEIKKLNTNYTFSHHYGKVCDDNSSCLSCNDKRELCNTLSRFPTDACGYKSHSHWLERGSENDCIFPFICTNCNINKFVYFCYNHILYKRFIVEWKTLFLHICFTGRKTRDEKKCCASFFTQKRSILYFCDVSLIIAVQTCNHEFLPPLISVSLVFDYLCGKAT